MDAVVHVPARSDAGRDRRAGGRRPDERVSDTMYSILITASHNCKAGGSTRGSNPLNIRPIPFLMFLIVHNVCYTRIVPTAKQ